MKKLNLNNLKLEANDLLQRNQLKTVFGGYGGGDKAACYCNSGESYTVDNCNECAEKCNGSICVGPFL